MSIIKVNHLSKHIKQRQILTDISFDIDKGECVALIGPNGAGKTTLMKCLLGDLIASKGTITIDGLVATHFSLRQQLNVLEQENRLPEKLKVSELVRFFHSIYNNSMEIDDVYELLQFSNEQKEQFSEKLSGGQRRLLMFVLTLIGQPKILFLDEPTAAMDTSTRKRFWEIINNLKSKGITIVYSSHYIEEVEHTADRVLVLHKGKLLRDATPHVIRQQELQKVFTVPSSLQTVVEQLGNITQLTIKRDTITFQTQTPDEVWQQLNQYCTIKDIEITNKTLLDTLFDQTETEGNE